MCTLNNINYNNKINLMIVYQDREVSTLFPVTRENESFTYIIIYIKKTIIKVI